MDLKLKRKEIRKTYFSTGGLIIISILGSVGMLMVVLSGLFSVDNMNDLYDCIFKNGMLIIFGLFFFVISLFCWITFFMNIILRPKQEILYLYKNKQDEIYFVNKKGKKFIYDTSDMKTDSYYSVLKTHDYIYEVLGKTGESWEPKEKNSYWLNLYSPIGNFNDIFLLPIVYIILLPGLLSFLMAKGSDKIYGLIFGAIPLYIIIYDLIYKIKLKKSKSGVVNDEKLYKSFEILKNIIPIIAVFILCVVLTITFLSMSDQVSRLIFSPFLGCGLCSAGLVLSKAFKNDKLERIFEKGFIIIFLMFWFGFLFVWTVGIIKQEENYLYGLFSVPFFLVGIFIIYKNFIKK